MTILQLIRKSKTAKALALLLVFEMTAGTLAPLRSYALTTGPSQPEVQSFEPVGTSEMVNAFGGDFTYNIPLLDVGGYPINISYNSGITMDQEASWVGLGWNINPGAITRSMRGIPDDFKGDQVKKTFSMKPNRTYGASVNVSGGEAFGLNLLTLSYGINMNYNNYKGVGFEQNLNMTLNSGKFCKGHLNYGLGVTSGSDGLNVSPSLSFVKGIKNKDDADLTGSSSLSLSFNSRSGLKRLALNAGVSESVRTSKVKNSHVKKTSYTSSMNGGSSWDFASPSYTPQVTLPMTNTSIALSMKTGLSFFGADATIDIGGYYSEQRLATNEQNIGAYGYMHTDLGSQYDFAMLDFNREKDGGYSENTTNLPLTSFTYDVYSVSGQGIGGTYRPYRSEAGYVYDPYAVTYSVSGNAGAEVGTGNLVHGGIDVSVTDVTTTSGRWSGDNTAGGLLKFRSTVAGDTLYEPFYFKEAGEKSIDSDTMLYHNTGRNQATRIALTSSGMTTTASGNFQKEFGGTTAIPTANYRTKRQKRNQVISTMTRTEAKNFGLQTDYYGASPTVYSSMPDHHIAEITTLRSDGSRYVFGLPAYNVSQKEATFNVQGRTKDHSTGLVTYSSGDNSTANTLGIDNYFSAMEVPAYAHSYMLTAIVSPDYVDYDGTVGPSKGDLGTYTKFNYTKATGSFNWRTPLGASSANYNDGMRSVSDDDKGSYIYGQKEVWYLSSIETKNYVAVFTTSDREDAYGATGESGTAGGTALKKLDKITLYSKPDYDANGSGALEIKVVNFEYDYSQCPSIPNHIGGSETGKLTLKKIFFTYGASFKAKLSPYQFYYGDVNHNKTYDAVTEAQYNPSYNLKGYNRWGYYKPNNVNNSNYSSLTGPLSPAEFPYVDQNKTNEDIYTQAWTLTTIKLPSGGQINVDYESDDYAYVQDRKAMQMFTITNLANPATDSDARNQNPVGGNTLSLMTAHSGNTANKYLYFKLQQPMSNSMNHAAVEDSLGKIYFNFDFSKLYFRFMVDITSSGDYEYVPGYVTMESYGIVDPSASGTTHYEYAWIKLKTVPIGDRVGSDQVHPISKAAWQFGRLHLPRKVWGEPDPQSGTVDQVITAMVGSSFFKNIKETFEGPNKTLRNKDYGKTAVKAKSFIRLTSPYGKKLGGGSRVKKITIADNWKAMNDAGDADYGKIPADAEYGQVYSYTTTDEYNRTVSSGVASYEPTLGGEENPFREPVFFKEEKKLVPDDESYLERPFGESFFPAASVGYSKVTVKNLQHTNVKRHATGYTVQEFYTAKDFPTIVREVPLEAKHKRTNPILSLLRVTMKDYMTVSQGYVIELNDMHGKPKTQLVYAEDQAQPISKVEYFYKTAVNNKKQLDNKVYVIKKDGSVSQNYSGMEYDFVADMREQQTVTVSGGLNMNLAGFIAGVFPLAIPTIFPSWSFEHTRFRSAVVTKVINRSGILEKTEAQDAGSTVSTQNLAWDAETGELLVTKTKNNFDADIYSFSYPAHWSYDRMGQAYQNLGVTFGSKIFTGGTSNTIVNAANYFVKGDEVGLTSGSTNIRAWVCNVGTNNISLVDKDGVAVANGTYSIKVYRSGRRNQQAMSTGSITTKTCPLVDNVGSDGIYDAISFSDVLNSQMQEYQENWTMIGGHSTGATCTCETGAATVHTYLTDLLDGLASAGQQLNTVTLWDGTNYHYGYGTSLNSAIGSPTPATWTPSVNGQTLTAVVGTCTLTLNLPAPYTWSQLTGLSAVTPASVNPNCTPTTNDFTATAEITVPGASAINVTVSGTSICWHMGDCTQSGTPANCGKLPGDTVNPYYENILGNWRPVRSHLYLADRTGITSGTTSDIEKHGVFDTKNLSTGSSIAFQPFWSPNSGNDWTKSPTYWTWSSEVSKFSPLGNEVENRDALSRHSAAVYGYNSSLPVAVGSNARYNEIAFDGFEDYSFNDAGDCRYHHFDFYGDMNSLSTDEAHTGIYSMEVGANATIGNSRPLTTLPCIPSVPSCPYQISPCDLLGTFSPHTYLPTKKFVFSCWVKQPGLTQPVFDYSNADVDIEINGSAVAMTLQRGEIIEGWQRLYGEFAVTNGSTGDIEVLLKNAHATLPMYFDDVRIHPFDGNMKSYVYHPVNLRFIAELDENNYATIYEYDEEGALIRVKKETERGIVTIKESRNNSSH